MATFLFWNLDQRPLERAIANLAAEHEVDVVLLAECTIPATTLLTSLNEGEARYHFPQQTSERIVIYTSFSAEFLEPAYDDRHLSIKRLVLPGVPEIIVACVHGPSKLWAGGYSQAECAWEMAEAIRKEEELRGHSRTLLIGDLNLNPFEEGIVGARGFHSVMARAVAERGTRTVNDKSYPYFYNPMWGHFGDRSGSVAGTYFYDKGDSAIHYWNIFDQVLLRPALLPYFQAEDVTIVTGDREALYLDGNGLPDRRRYSDHLPVLCRLRV